MTSSIVILESIRKSCSAPRGDCSGMSSRAPDATGRGEIPIGSTIGLVELYQLVAALQVIKAWSETAFCKNLDQ